VLRLRRPRSPVHALRRAAAGLLAVVAVVLAVRPSPAPVRAAPGARTVPLAVARHDLSPGTELREADLRVAAFPADLAPRGGASEAVRLRGRVLAAAVRAGEPVTDVRLLGAGLTALLAPGQVAAPVRPADLAVTALVHAGDRVDVLATPADAAQAEVIADRALVLAAPPSRSGTAASGGAATEDDPAGLLLLAVDGPTAARLAAASAGATLTVTLTPS
jgi:pilus assembly protein CpaB